MEEYAKLLIMEYKVAIVETYREIVEVEAENEDEALSSVWEKYQNEDNMNGSIELESVKVELA